MKKDNPFKKIIEKSKLTLKDALALGKKANEKIYEEYKMRKN